MLPDILLVCILALGVYAWSVYFRLKPRKYGQIVIDDSWRLAGFIVFWVFIGIGLAIYGWIMVEALLPRRRGAPAGYPS